MEKISIARNLLTMLIVKIEILKLQFPAGTDHQPQQAWIFGERVGKWKHLISV